jgi:hypothetical protein
VVGDLAHRIHAGDLLAKGVNVIVEGVLAAVLVRGDDGINDLGNPRVLAVERSLQVVVSRRQGRVRGGHGVASHDKARRGAAG